MKQTLLLFLTVITLSVNAQKFSNAGEYMTAFSQQSKQISEDMWSYTSAVAHGKSARKVANRRKELIGTVSAAKRKVMGMPGYEDDKSLRDSLASYLDLNYKVLTEDYAKIMDMEEIAEQSYDAMEAYLLAQEKAGDKLDAAAERLQLTQEAFAKRHNVNLIHTEDKLSKNLKNADKVIKYYNMINLIFFKSYKQEFYMQEAMKKNDMNGIEQNRDALAKVSVQGLQKLDTVKAYNGDLSVKNACANLLKFYKKESTEKVPLMSDFYLKKENFDKVKAAFDAKGEKDRKKEDVDSFNKAVNEYNAASNKYNAISQELDKERMTLINTWNETVARFLDKNIAKR